MEKKDFLSYIESVLDTKSEAFYSENDKHFYFYYKNFMFYIDSTPSSAALIITENKSVKEYSEAIDLTVEEAKHFILKCMALTPNNNISSEEEIELYGGLDKLEEDLEHIKEFLKSPTLEEEIKNSKAIIAKVNIDDYDLEINLRHVLREDHKLTILLTSMFVLPVYISKPEETRNRIVKNILIPSWEIKNYPILANNFNIKVFGTDFSEKIDKIMNTFPSGAILLKDSINFLLKKTDKNPSHPVHKI